MSDKLERRIERHSILNALLFHVALACLPVITMCSVYSACNRPRTIETIRAEQKDCPDHNSPCYLIRENEIAIIEEGTKNQNYSTGR
jgi:hypothetical protein